MKKLILLLLFSLNIFAQGTEDKIKALIPELDAKFQDFKVKSHLSSVAYAVMLDGKIIYQSNSGIVNYKTNKTADNQSIYRIASMSKSFASVAILQEKSNSTTQFGNTFPNLKDKNIHPIHPKLRCVICFRTQRVSPKTIRGATANWGFQKKRC